MNIKSTHLALIALYFFATGCHAFMLGKTRVVLPQDNGSTSLVVISGKQDPLSLIRSKITREIDDNEPVNNFMITPPLFRLDAGGKGMVRISLVSSQGLPVDRESLFYLNVAAIPSSNPLARNNQAGFSGGSLLVGTGNIIKFFYRPHGIKAPDDSVWKTLHYSRVPGGILVSNPTPWHASFASMAVDGTPTTFNKMQPRVLPPFGRQVYGTNSTLKKQVKWAILDDKGNAVTGTSAIE